MEIYSEDFQYLQDAVETECKNIIDSVMDNNGSPVIVEGFNPIIDPDDSTKIKVTQSGGQGKLLTSSGIMLTTSSDYSGISLANSTPGITNIITAVITTTYGTYNKDTLVVDEGVQNAIDYYDYTNVYNRSIITGSIICYTSAQYSALTNKGWVVILGTVYVDTITGALVISTSGRVYAKTRITNESVELDDLSTDFMLPQTMVEYTPIATVDDQFYGSPVDLVTDLNDIRTQIRNIKVTENWDDYLVGAAANDPEMNYLHRSGIFVDKLTGFNYTLSSTGTSIEIGGGKLLINNQLIYDEAPGSLSIPAGESTTVGDYTEAKPGITSETQYFANDTSTVILAHKPIDYDSIHIFSRDVADTYKEYIKDTDYTVNETNGTITAISGRDIDNETVDVYYTWGNYRTDLITISSTGIHYVEGTPTSTHKPLPPSITSSGVVPLYYISRLPMTDTITSSGISKVNFETIPVKELRELNYNDIAQYQGDGGAYNELITSDLGTMGFFATATDLSVAKASGWDEFSLDSGTGTGTSTGITMNDTVYMETYMYTRSTDKIWLLCKPVSTATTITFGYEATCGSGTYTNVTRTMPYFSGPSIPDNIIPLLLLESGVSEGITKMKLSITSGASSISFWKILVGGSDLSYIYPSLKNSICSFDALINRGVVSTNYNLSGGPSALHSNNSGTNSTAFGYHALYTNNTNDNSGFGSYALYSTNAINNSGFGSRVLYTNSSGIGNSGFGSYALYNNNASYNSGFGTNALYTNSIGVRNTANGYQALYNSVGDDNTGFGHNALYNITTGSYRNTALGSGAGDTLTTGHNVTCIGYKSQPSSATTSNELSLGDDLVVSLRMISGLIPKFRNGLELSYSNATTVGVSAGTCSDSINTTIIKSPTALTITGTGAAGWYHCFIRREVATGTVIAISSSVSPITWNSTTIPWSTTTYNYRYLGSFYWTGAAVRTFNQTGNMFLWSQPTQDFMVVPTEPDGSNTTSYTGTIAIPSGINCLAFVDLYTSEWGPLGAGYMITLLSCPDDTDYTPDATHFHFLYSAYGDYNGPVWVRTNTSSQIRIREFGGQHSYGLAGYIYFGINTHGYINPLI